jgi:hypothetical protein
MEYDGIFLNELFIRFRYNAVRPPNNENNCTANPNEEEFQQQVQNAQYF